jgi:hypothetical protein|tara:strand:- start:425 stop:619 length:195 start_codon:yes stop_codon:yes gene_type:complete
MNWLMTRWKDEPCKESGDRSGLRQNSKEKNGYSGDTHKKEEKVYGVMIRGVKARGGMKASRAGV